MRKKIVVKDSAVKIDSILNKEIEEFIRRYENRLRFVNKKHFVDLAIQNFLEKVKGEYHKK